MWAETNPYVRIAIILIAVVAIVSGSGFFAGFALTPPESTHEIKGKDGSGYVDDNGVISIAPQKFD